MSFLQFVWSKKWFDLNSSAAVVVTASVSAATVKMMKSPNLCIMVLSLKCNCEDGRSFCHQIKSHIGWKDEVKTKQVITFSRPQTNWGGRVLCGLEPIHNIGPSPGLYSSLKMNSSCYIKFIWIFYEHITSVPYTFVPTFFWCILRLHDPHEK